METGNETFQSHALSMKRNARCYLLCWKILKNASF